MADHLKAGKLGSGLTSQIVPGTCACVCVRAYASAYIVGLRLHKASLSWILMKRRSRSSLLRHNINTLQLGDSILWYRPVEM